MISEKREFRNDVARKHVRNIGRLIYITFSSRTRNLIYPTSFIVPPEQNRSPDIITERISRIRFELRSGLKVRHPEADYYLTLFHVIRSTFNAVPNWSYLAARVRKRKTFWNSCGRRGFPTWHSRRESVRPTVAEPKFGRAHSLGAHSPLYQ